MTSKRRDRRTRRCFARSAGQFCQSLLRQFLPQAKLPHTFAEGGHNDSHKCGHSAYKTHAVEGWFPGAGVHREQRMMKDFVRAGHQFGIDVVAEIVDKGRSVSVTTDGACIGNQLKELRESKELSQSDIEKRSGLLRCYISWVENGHTVPSVETLEKMARALEVPMYRLFHDGEVPAGLSKLKPPKDDEFGSTGGDCEFPFKFLEPTAHRETRDQKLILHITPKNVAELV